MIDFEPSYLTFDCYGTLIDFQMPAAAQRRYADRIPPSEMGDFLADFKAYHIDEVLGAYKPYPEVVTGALKRVTARWQLEYRDADGEAIVAEVPTWGPHPGVPEVLNRLAAGYPLVILSNAADDQIKHNVEKLRAPFHAVYTAEQAGAYKPRMRPFEYMLDSLGCGPGDILHVSSSVRYDLIPAHDLRITNKVYLNRGFEPSVPYYGYHEITDIADLLALLGRTRRS